MPSAHRPARGERDPQLRLRKLRQLRIGILGGAEVAYSSTNARLPGIAGASRRDRRPGAEPRMQDRVGCWKRPLNADSRAELSLSRAGGYCFGVKQHWSEAECLRRSTGCYRTGISSEVWRAAIGGRAGVGPRSRSVPHLPGGRGHADAGVIGGPALGHYALLRSADRDPAPTTGAVGKEEARRREDDDHDDVLIGGREEHVIEVVDPRRVG